MHKAILRAITAIVATGFVLGAAQPSFANCGGHCQQAHVCGEMVKQKALKDASVRHAEYNKCMTDPHNYK